MRNSGCRAQKICARMRCVMWVKSTWIGYQKRAPIKIEKHIFCLRCFGHHHQERTSSYTCAQSLFASPFSSKTTSTKKKSTLGSWESLRESLRIQYMRWKEERRFFFFARNFCFVVILYFRYTWITLKYFVRGDEKRKKRRSRRPRKRASNEDRMVKWKWMSFMFPSCVVVLRSCLPMRWDFFFSAFRLTSRMSLRRHY